MATTKKQIIDALRACGGWQSQAAKKLNITQGALSQRISGNADIRAALDEIKEQYLDLAESKLITAINDRESWAICFYLKCRGKDRGYVEKVNVVAEAQKPIEVIFKKA
jgi:predicted transcriptional regulator